MRKQRLKEINTLSNVRKPILGGIYVFLAPPPQKKTLVFLTLSSFSAQIYSIFPWHSGWDLIIVILKIRKEPQGDDFMKVTQEGFYILIRFSPIK